MNAYQADLSAMHIADICTDFSRCVMVFQFSLPQTPKLCNTPQFELEQVYLWYDVSCSTANHN